MYIPGSDFTFGPAIRTGPPYIARHVEWYTDSRNLPQEERHYRMRREPQFKAKRASVLRSHSKGPESAGSARMGEVYSWASQLASKSREPHWISDSYLMPSEVSHLLTHLRSVGRVVFPFKNDSPSSR